MHVSLQVCTCVCVCVCNTGVTLTDKDSVWEKAHSLEDCHMRVSAHIENFFFFSLIFSCSSQSAFFFWILRSFLAIVLLHQGKQKSSDLSDMWKQIPSLQFRDEPRRDAEEQACYTITAVA